MRTILIADDERIERDGIKFLLEEGSYNLKIIEAVNGKQAIEYLKQNKIDILLTDIKMPFVDGLQLAKEALKIDSNIKCIIFSGFSEFEFAKTAIQLGVSDYILKPVDLDEFNRTMNKVMQELDAEEKEKDRTEENINFIKEHILYQLVNGVSLEKVKERMEGFTKFVSGYGYNRMILIESNHNFIENADRTFVETLKKEFGIPFYYLNLNMQQGLLFLDKTVKVDDGILAERIYQFINSHYKESCYLVVSGVFEDMGQIGEAYTEMELKMEEKFYQSDKHVLKVGDIAENNIQNSPDEELVKVILSDIRNKDIANLNKNFGILCNKYRLKSNFSQIYIKFVFTTILKEIITNLSISDERTLGEEIEVLYRSDDIRTVIQIIERYIRQYEEAINSSDTSREIQTVKNYIYNNYQKDISVELLADLVFRAPNYLRFIFKKETGYNLSKFIKAYRMEKAKEYLNDSQMKVAKVCELVGYTNVSYFCKNFKSYYGMSPEQYRKTGKTYEEDHTLYSRIEITE